VTAIVRYVTADVVRSQRWVAPVLVYAFVIFAVNASSEPLLSTYAGSAAFLFPVAIWVTSIVNNAEDPVQTDISIATVGSATRLQVGKLVTALAAVGVLAAVALFVPLAIHDYPGATAWSDVAAGAVGHLLVAALGVSVGAFSARAVIGRAGWFLLAGVWACLGEVLVPHAPPVRALLVLFDEQHPASLLRSVTAIGLETTVVALSLTGAAIAIARRRS
jgi:hypothetical protein